MKLGIQKLLLDSTHVRYSPPSSLFILFLSNLQNISTYVKVEMQETYHGEIQALKTNWEDAIWVGIAKKSNEHIVILENGGPAMRRRTIKRKNQDSRWDASKVAEMRATPRHPNPMDEQDADMKAEANVQVEFKEIEPDLRLPRPETQGPREVKRRNFRITKKILEK